jgi:hypothetical protein
LGRENLLSREDVARLQGLRGMYGIASPAPICTDDSIAPISGQLECQVVQAPESQERLVPTLSASSTAKSPLSVSSETEIRLTYRELSALIEDALRALK